MSVGLAQMWRVQRLRASFIAPQEIVQTIGNGRGRRDLLRCSFEQANVLQWYRILAERRVPLGNPSAIALIDWSGKECLCEHVDDCCRIDAVSLGQRDCFSHRAKG